MSHTVSLKAEIIKCRMKNTLNSASLVIVSPAGELTGQAAKQIQI